VSYILDAIKQSERQRNRGQVPDVRTWQPENQAQPASRRGLWWALGSLALLASLLGWTLLGAHPQASLPAEKAAQSRNQPDTSADVAAPATDDSDEGLLLLPQEAQQLGVPMQLDLDAAPVPPQRTTTAAPHASASPDHFDHALTASPTASPVTIAKVTMSGTADRSRLNEAITSEPAVPTQSTDASNRGRTPDPARTEESMAPRVPYWRQLPVEVQRRLPELQFTLHVYAQEPAQRMVKVNGRIAHQGQYVGTSLKLEEIVPDGVILSFEGQKFMMKVN